MKIYSKAIQLKTKEFLEIRDVTQIVQDVVTEGKVTDGIALVYSKHTTMTIRVNEQEGGMFKDFKDFVARLVPKDVYYRHNDLTIRTENVVCSPGASDCLNAHSHLLHLLMGNSETLPIAKGELVLGTYQRVFVVELDCARPREIYIQVMGR